MRILYGLHQYELHPTSTAKYVSFMLTSLSDNNNDGFVITEMSAARKPCLSALAHQNHETESVDVHERKLFIVSDSTYGVCAMTPKGSLGVGH
jgi:hypothetical protein